MGAHQRSKVQPPTLRYHVLLTSSRQASFWQSYVQDFRRRTSGKLKKLGGLHPPEPPLFPTPMIIEIRILLPMARSPCTLACVYITLHNEKNLQKWHHTNSILNKCCITNFSRNPCCEREEFHLLMLQGPASWEGYGEYTWEGKGEKGRDQGREGREGEKERDIMHEHELYCA